MSAPCLACPAVAAGSDACQVASAPVAEAESRWRPQIDVTGSPPADPGDQDMAGCVVCMKLS